MPSKAPSKAPSTPQGSTPKTAKVVRSAVSKSTPIKAPKDAGPSDRDIAFLLNCIKFSHNDVDYKRVADALDMNVPAVRMRYSRIRTKMDGQDAGSTGGKAANSGSVGAKGTNK